MINRSTLTRVCPLDTPDLEFFSGGHHGSESDVDDLEDEPKLLSGLIAQRHPAGVPLVGRVGVATGAPRAPRSQWSADPPQPLQPGRLLIIRLPPRRWSAWDLRGRTTDSQVV